MRRQRHQTIETVTTLYNGKLRLERRNTNPTIHARAFLHGSTVGKTTGETTLAAATKVATDWYLDQLDRIRRGEVRRPVPLFSDIAEAFLTHVEQQAEVSAGQRKNQRDKWTLLRPFFEHVRVADVDDRFLLTLRDQRSHARTFRGTLVKPVTIKKDFDFVRCVLRLAKRERHLTELPEFPRFRGPQWTCTPSPRPFLNLAQWRTVRDLAKVRAAEPDLNPRTRRQRQELYAFVMLCVGAALRVGEAQSLRWTDCQLVRLNDRRRTQAVHLWVLGKHSRGQQREEGFGLYDAVVAFKLLRAARLDARPDDLLFTENHRDGMRDLLVAAGLRTDTKTGRTRDAKSLRQTGISLRLDYGPTPDYRDIAKWARTSPAMIATFYDQTHPQQSVERIAGFRVPKTKKRKKPTDRRRQNVKSNVI